VKQPLQLENIELGGMMQAANEALGEICQDIIHRPHKSAAREVTIKIKVKPEIREMGDRSINQPNIDWSVETKMPGHQGMTTRAYVEGDKVLINTGDPLGNGHPDQTTIFDNNERRSA
jgi:hypothetical protein